MKKYLMNGAMALVLGAMAASCSNDEGFSTIEELTTAQYQAAFEARFPNYDRNHNWGFTTFSKARTRAAALYGWELSTDYPVEFDKQYFDDILTYLPEEVSAGDQLTNYEFESNGEFQFSIIYSQTSANDKVGYYYYNPATETIADRHEVVFVEDIQDYTYVQAGYEDQYAEGGYRWDGLGALSAAQFWGWGATKAHAKVFTVNIPAGYRVGYFIENTKDGTPRVYSNSTLNTQDTTDPTFRPEGVPFYYSAVVTKDDKAYLVGLEDWFYSATSHEHVADCNDVIIAINKKTSTPPTVVDIDDNEKEDVVKGDVRVIAEDLTVDEQGDFDFNDVVFDVKFDYPEGKTTIILQAAGGTLPLYIDGVEVHEKFGVGTGTMVNCGNRLTVSKEPVVFVLDQAYTNANDIPVKVTKKIGEQTQDVTLAAIKGRAPSKIQVGIDYDWCEERQDIENKYPDFKQWVEGSVEKFY